jgi:hypothetical protein
MIGLERGGARVIGNYGMRREFEFSSTLLSARLSYYICNALAGVV